jgi:hypothetical protein
MERAKYKKLPHDGRTRIDETKKPHNKITTPSLSSPIPHPRPETITGTTYTPTILARHTLR